MSKNINPQQITGVFTPQTKNNIPTAPGVYLYKNEENTIIYIGKAKNLRKRVASYFNKNHSYLKTHLLVQEIKSIDVIAVSTEKEALLLEATLIKKHLPKFNINFKDGKFYPYIKITTTEEFPRIFVTRNKYDDKNLYFGPYISSASVRSTIEIIQKLFQIRTCKTLPKKACLEYHMNRCSAPCIDNISAKDYKKNINKAIKFLSGNKEQTIKDLQKQMQQAAKDLLFEKAQIYKEQLDSLLSLDQKQQVYLSTEYNYDIIGIFERMGHISIVVTNIHLGKLVGKEGFIVKIPDASLNAHTILEEFIVNKYARTEIIPHKILINDEFADICESTSLWLQEDDVSLSIETITDIESQEHHLLQIAEHNARINLEQSLSEPDILAVLQQLQQTLSLEQYPSIIEGFDVAKLDGTLASGVVVQFKGGTPNKDAYRLYNIKAENQQDDYAGIEESVYRHYKNQLELNAPLPQLIVIDGGKGQLKAALKALKKLNLLHLNVISLTKKEEEIFRPNEKFSLILERNSPILHLIQRIRDESHRFSQFQLHRRMNKKMKE